MRHLPRSSRCLLQLEALRLHDTGNLLQSCNMAMITICKSSQLRRTAARVACRVVKRRLVDGLQLRQSQIIDVASFHDH